MTEHQQQSHNRHAAREMLDTPSLSKLQGEHRFLQHNVGRKQEAQQTLLEIGLGRQADFILVQEPSVWKDNNTNTWFSIPHSSYELLLPEVEKRPRVAIYISQHTRLQYKNRPDLSLDPDLQILEITGTTEPFLLIHMYNEKEQGATNSQTPTARTIARKLLPLQQHLQALGLPFLLAGDCNCHGFLWNTSITNESSEARQFTTWLQFFNCMLLNTEQEGTFFRSNLTSTSIIDLAFVSGFQTNKWDNWCRAEDTGSDHITIGFSMFTANARVFLNPLGDLPFALHKADWQLFQDTLKEQEQELNIQQRL